MNYNELVESIVDDLLNEIYISTEHDIAKDSEAAYAAGHRASKAYERVKGDKTSSPEKVKAYGDSLNAMTNVVKSHTALGSDERGAYRTAQRTIDAAELERGLALRKATRAHHNRISSIK